MTEQSVTELKEDTSNCLERIKKMKINYVPVADSIAEMRNNKQFRRGVINPTHKLVWINFEVFEEFLYWKQHGYVRTKDK